jgi:hypothetical protein
MKIHQLVEKLLVGGGGHWQTWWSHKPFIKESRLKNLVTEKEGIAEVEIRVNFILKFHGLFFVKISKVISTHSILATFKRK